MPRFRTLRRTVVAPLFALAAVSAAGTATACARTMRGSAAPQEETTLVVRNQGFLDMAVWVLRGGVRSRLGTATGNRNTTFRIPTAFVQPLTALRFVAHPIGSQGSTVSQEIIVSPGDEVELIIPPGT